MSTLNVRIVGTKVELQASFRNSLGELADPDAVGATIRLPDDSIVDLSASILNPSVGVYTVAYTIEQNGLHQYRFAGTGSIEVAGEGQFLGQTEFESV